jgi:hypothetical protein
MEEQLTLRSATAEPDALQGDLLEVGGLLRVQYELVQLLAGQLVAKDGDAAVQRFVLLLVFFIAGFFFANC